MYRKTDGHVARALTIAGSDSGGGAGIQADLKTMHQFGVYGMSALTALTAQNTLGVQGILEVSPDFVESQLQSVLSDIGVDAVKTGMLANAVVMNVVADFLERNAVSNIVADPVMVAKGGQSLVAETSTVVLRERIVPLADVLTPNLPEAGVLCGYSVDSWAAAHQAARDLAASGSRTVVIKGGHMPQGALGNFKRTGHDEQVGGHVKRTRHDEQVSARDASAELLGPVSADLVYQSGTFTYLMSPRVSSVKTHGTGCTFSAAITSLLARGYSILDAIANAKAFIFCAIDGAKDWDVGGGHGPTDHSARVSRDTGFEPSCAYFFDGSKWTQIDVPKHLTVG